jgi:hypothetical protein
MALDGRQRRPGSARGPRGAGERNPYSANFSNRKAAGDFRSAAAWLKTAEVNGRKREVFFCQFPTNSYEKCKKVRFGAKNARQKS